MKPSTRKDSTFSHMIRIVRSIPKGKVASYGQVAALAGFPRGARMVAWAMHTLSNVELAKTPWWRVVNRHGIISTTCQEHTGLMQRDVLEAEGVNVQNVDGVLQIDLHKFGWLRGKHA